MLHPTDMLPSWPMGYVIILRKSHRGLRSVER